MKTAVQKEADLQEAEEDRINLNVPMKIGTFFLVDWFLL